MVSPPPVMTRRGVLWPRTLINHFIFTLGRNIWQDNIISETRTLGLPGKVTCQNGIQKTLRGIERSQRIASITTYDYDMVSQ